MQGLLVFNTVGLFGGKINKRSNTWHYLIDTSLTLVILGSVTTCFIRGKFRLHEKNKSKRQSRAEDLVNHGLTIDWNWSTYIRLNWICLEILHIIKNVNYQSITLKLSLLSDLLQMKIIGLLFVCFNIVTRALRASRNSRVTSMLGWSFFLS